MVGPQGPEGDQGLHFQYSLCRVVLMVALDVVSWMSSQNLSVLALSSRFDGLRRPSLRKPYGTPFSTRSVESF